MPETWVVDLERRAIERFTKPGPNGYQEDATPHDGDEVRPVLLPKVELQVNDLLSPAVAATVEKPPENEGQT